MIKRQGWYPEPIPLSDVEKIVENERDNILQTFNGDHVFANIDKALKLYIHVCTKTNIVKPFITEYKGYKVICTKIK